MTLKKCLHRALLIMLLVLLSAQFTLAAGEAKAKPKKVNMSAEQLKKNLESGKFNFPPIDINVKNQDCENVLGVFTDLTKIPVEFKATKCLITFKFTKIPIDEFLSHIIKNCDLLWQIKEGKLILTNRDPETKKR